MANISGTGAFGSFTLKVTPEELQAGSMEIGNCVGNLRDAFERISTIAQNTSGYWNGDASDAHRELFASIKPIMEEILNRYTEHSRDLDDIAKTYIDAEAQNVREIESLPSNPLS